MFVSSATRTSGADTRQRSPGSLEASLDDLGSATFRADLASLRHETQYTRLFRS
jgi:urease accessory protein